MNLEKNKWNLGKIKTDFIGPYIYIYIAKRNSGLAFN